nr:Chain P, KRAS-G12wt-9 [Homo sapiens]
VVGAGGVGK